MVLPWPGSNACIAPSPAAMSAAESKNQKLNLPCVEISSVKRLRGVFRAGVGAASATTFAGTPARETSSPAAGRAFAR